MHPDLKKATDILSQGNYTCVICREDQVLTATERGVKPLLSWLDAGLDLGGFSAADRVVGRATALSQVMGYLVAENGIFILGIPLMTEGSMWFELSILLDVFAAIFVMAIAINHINGAFGSIDVARFRNLRD